MVVSKVMSTIEEGDFIKVSYTGKLEDGTVFDTTDKEVAEEAGIYSEEHSYGGDVIVVGAGHVVEGLDEAFVGRDLGEEDTVEVPPEKGFGERDEEQVQTVSITKFDERPQPGQRKMVNGRPGTIETVIGRRVRVDYNHPLAGETLTYEFKIDAKIVDPVEKLRGLIKMYTEEELEATIEDGVAEIEVPLEMTFNQQWLMGKRRVAEEIMERLDVDEVHLIEKFTSPEKQALEAAEEAQEEIEEEIVDEE